MAKNDEFYHKRDEDPKRPIQFRIVPLVLVDLQLIGSHILFLEISAQEGESITIFVEWIVDSFFDIMAREEASLTRSCIVLATYLLILGPISKRLLAKRFIVHNELLRLRLWIKRPHCIAQLLKDFKRTRIEVCLILIRIEDVSLE